MRWFRKRNETTEHEYVEERLSAYLDGELSQKEWAVVDRHLAACQSCQWNLATLKQTIQWTREMPAVPVPRVFTIPASAAPARRPRRNWGFVPLLQGATAIVALLLFFVMAGLGRSEKVGRGQRQGRRGPHASDAGFDCCLPSFGRVRRTTRC